MLQPSFFRYEINQRPKPLYSWGLFPRQILPLSLGFFPAPSRHRWPRAEDCSVFQDLWTERARGFPFHFVFWVNFGFIFWVHFLLFALSPFQVFCWESEDEWNTQVLAILRSLSFFSPWQVNDILAGNRILMSGIFCRFSPVSSSFRMGSPRPVLLLLARK